MAIDTMVLVSYWYYSLILYDSYLLVEAVPDNAMYKEQDVRICETGMPSEKKRPSHKHLQSKTFMLFESTSLKGNSGQV